MDKVKAIPADFTEIGSFAETLNAFRTARAETIESMAYNLSCLSETGECSENTVNSWLYRNKIPGKQNWQLLRRYINHYSADENTASLWIKKLSSQRLGSGKAATTKNLDGSMHTDVHVKQLLADNPGNSQSTTLLIQDMLRQSDTLNNLPALFETGVSMPLASAYVELNLAPNKKISANPFQLEQNLSIREVLEKRANEQYLVKKSPEDVLDKQGYQHTLLLGSPGSGKSSLLRKLAHDIASNQWHDIKIPLLVELRAYWNLKCQDNKLTLLDYALDFHLPKSPLSKQVLREFIYENSEKVILLLDGLDEIAGAAAAVTSVYEEIRTIGHHLSWLVSSRPNGVMAQLNESQRCELVNLDDDAMERLIENWQSFLTQSNVGFPAEKLKLEIFSTANLYAMARNPFLLSCLCYLKYHDPNAVLPVSRTQVYNALFLIISVQAQQRSANVLTPAVRAQLSAFCFYLYTEPHNAPVQIFTEEQWWQFQQAKEDNFLSCNFKQDVLPARLITSLQEPFGLHHFLHLSLQEYLVAEQLARLPLETALEKRFSPSWRNIFSFYAGLLLTQQDHVKFRKLLIALYQERDFSGIHLITITEVCACAGVKDTSEWLDVDLREILFAQINAGYDLVPEAIISALAQMDSSWLEQKIITKLGEYLRPYEYYQFSVQEDLSELTSEYLIDPHESYPGRTFMVNGRQSYCPYTRLAYTRTPKSKLLISSEFFGSSQSRALLSAHAFSLVATPSDRAKVLLMAESAVMFDDHAARVFAFAQSGLREDYLPFLARVLRHFSSNGKEPFQETLHMIADIGGETAVSILLEQAKYELKHFEQFNCFDVVLASIIELGGAHAVNALNILASHPALKEWNHSLPFWQFEANASNTETMLQALEDSQTYDEALHSIAIAAISGRIASDEIVKAVKQGINLTSLENIDHLCNLEYARIESGRSTILCPDLLAIATINIHRLSDADGAYDSGFLISQLRLLLQTLAIARFKPAESIVEKLLYSDTTNQEVLAMAVNAAGFIFKGTGNTTVLDRLQSLLFSERIPDLEAITTAIGRVSLQRLFLLQSAGTALDSIEILCAESGYMLFQDFWVDEFGKKTYWQAKPRRILHIYDEAEPSYVDIYGHLLSQFYFESCLNEMHDSHEAVFLHYVGDLVPLEQVERCLGKDWRETTINVFHISGITEEQAAEDAIIKGRAVLTMLSEA